MKKLKVSINDHKHEICFDYDEEYNELIIDIIDSKGNALDRHKINIIIKELIKGFRVEESCMALQILRKKDSPIVLYTDDDGNINPALFYERNEFDTMDEVELNIPRLKREKVFNIGSKIATYFLLLGLIITFCQDRLQEKEFDQNIKTHSEKIENEFDEEYIYNTILINENLTEEQKNLLISSKFIRDLAETPMTSEQKTVLYFHLKNLNVKNYNAIQKGIYSVKNMLGMDNMYGYVLDGNHRKDTIYMLETSSNYSDYVLVHELIHIAQLDSEYSYLKEASAEIISHEYWDRPIISYQNAVKRIYALMTIVGPEVVWDANFTSTSALEEEISKYLTPEQVLEFMGYLKVKPYNQHIDDETGIGKVDNALDDLLKIMYEKKFNKPYDEDQIVQAIYNMDSEGNFVYCTDGKILKTPNYFFNKDKFMKTNEEEYQKKIVK